VSVTVYRFRNDAAVDDVVRDILATELGDAPRIAIGAHGKPYLVDGKLDWNLAHSGDLALLAISRTGPVGIDLEQHRVLRDPGAIAARYFTDREARAIAADASAFFRIWVRKEAVVKAAGTGLIVTLDQLDVLDDVVLTNEPVDSWCLHDVELEPGYSAALATRRVEPVRIVVR